MLGHHFQDIGNKSYISVLWRLFETKTPKAHHNLDAGASLRDRDTGNKSYILVLRHHFETQTPATNQDTGKISLIFVLGYHFEYILVMGHHFETKTPATNRASSCWGTTSRPRHWQQNVHLSAGAFRDQDTINKSYILVLGHHFETKTPATNRTS